MHPILVTGAQSEMRTTVCKKPIYLLERKKYPLTQEWWYMPVTLSPWEAEEEGGKTRASLDYIRDSSSL